MDIAFKTVADSAGEIFMRLLRDSRVFDVSEAGSMPVNPYTLRALAIKGPSGTAEDIEPYFVPRIYHTYPRFEEKILDPIFSVMVKAMESQHPTGRHRLVTNKPSQVDMPAGGRCLVAGSGGIYLLCLRSPFDFYRGGYYYRFDCQWNAVEIPGEQAGPKTERAADSVLITA